MQLVYMDPRRVRAPRFASVVTAILAPGSFVEGVTLGVEIAQRAGRHHGPADAVRPGEHRRLRAGRWIGLYDTIEQVQASDGRIGADLDFAKLVDEKARRPTWRDTRPSRSRARSCSPPPGRPGRRRARRRPGWPRPGAPRTGAPRSAMLVRWR